MECKADSEMLEAIVNGDSNGIAAALAAGANPNVTYSQRGSPLHLAVMVGPIDIVSTLIVAGANVNARDLHGRTPLHYASFANDDIQIIKRLLDAGAEINAQDTKGLTPLDCAVGMGIDATTAALFAAGGKTKRSSRNWTDTAIDDIRPNSDRSRP